MAEQDELLREQIAVGDQEACQRLKVAAAKEEEIRVRKAALLSMLKKRIENKKQEIKKDKRICKVLQKLLRIDPKSNCLHVENLLVRRFYDNSYDDFRKDGEDKIQRCPKRRRRTQRTEDDSHDKPDLKQKKQRISKRKKVKRTYQAIYENDVDEEIKTMSNYEQACNPSKEKMERHYRLLQYLKKRKKRNKDTSGDDICVLDVVDINREDYLTSDSQDTMKLIDMSEGEPDDGESVFPNNPIVFSENYYKACAVLDRVLERPEIIASVVNCRFMLQINKESEVNVLSRDLCECLLQYPESTSRVVLTEGDVENFAPARRTMKVDFTVAGVELSEMFIVVEDTALISAALGRQASLNLITGLRNFGELTHYRRLILEQDEMMTALKDDKLKENYRFYVKSVEESEKVLAEKQALISIVRQRRSKIELQKRQTQQACESNIFETEVMKTSNTANVNTPK